MRARGCPRRGSPRSLPKFCREARAADIKVDSTSGMNPQLKYAREAAAECQEKARRTGIPFELIGNQLLCAIKLLRSLPFHVRAAHGAWP
jgi:hypothetical protein